MNNVPEGAYKQALQGFLSLFSFVFFSLSYCSLKMFVCLTVYYLGFISSPSFSWTDESNNPMYCC